MTKEDFVISLHDLIIEEKLDRLFRWWNWFPADRGYIVKQFSTNDYDDMTTYLKDSKDVYLIGQLQEIKWSMVY